MSPSRKNDGSKTMAVRTLNSDNFDQALKNDSTVVIIFRADWCGPCELFEEDYRKVAERNEDVLFNVVDVERDPQLADDFGIEMIPTLVIIRERNLLFSHSGRVSSSALDDLLDQARAVLIEELP